VLAKNESTRLLTGHAATTDLEVAVATKKPCSICRRWFETHPRAGSRQRVCSAVECQRERQPRAVAAWRKRNPDYDGENRLRAKVVKAEAPWAEAAWIS
jgi:hypothetical protein